MASYAAPVADMQFTIEALGGLESVARLPGCDDVTPELVGAVFEAAGKFAADVLAPLNQSGDRQGCSLENGVVRMPAGFSEAYAGFVAGGWNGVAFPTEYGGQGLPWLVATAVSEIWHGANMSFGLCPMLTQAAVEVLLAYGSPWQQTLYLPKLVSGEWCGTMNLTEAGAGSDLARVRTVAVRNGDAYGITGQKTFISFGEHDLADNIIHMVLARTPDAPDGIKGLSLFMVPKFLLEADGTLGRRNDVRCLSIEHKLGINASPTAVMSYGDDGGAVGFRIGGENRGIEYMFAMMNTSRLAVGSEGVGVAERAYQQARAYALERRQGRVAGQGGNAPAAIVDHPDVRRMLLSMKARTEAARALTYFVAASVDVARRHPDGAMRDENAALVDLLTPVVKAWCSEIGIETADTGIQVHGGMGYMEETGAAQYLRDARVAAIYEGTNGIQANDLVGRKLLRDGGGTALRFIAMVGATAAELAQLPGGDAPVIGARLHGAVEALSRATDWLLATGAEDPPKVAAGAPIYLRLMGDVAGGWLMARTAVAAIDRLEAGGDGQFLRGKLISARFFADHVLPRADALATIFAEGSVSIIASEREHL